MFSKVRTTQFLAGIATWLVVAVASLAPLSLAVAADGITPEILAAARTEGQVTYYTSADSRRSFTVSAIARSPLGPATSLRPQACPRGWRRHLVLSTAVAWEHFVTRQIPA